MSIRVRSSVKWTARTGVTPGTIGSSVNGAHTVIVIPHRALRPPESNAVTPTYAVPGPYGPVPRPVALTAVNVKTPPATAAVTACGSEEDTT